VQISLSVLRHRLRILPEPELDNFSSRRIFATFMFMCVASICGCAGSVSTPKNSSGFSVSGTISPAASGSGTTLALSGPTAASTTASSNGSYSFSGLSSGTYSIAPEHSGYTFEPTVQSAVVSGANVSGVNFTATQVSTHTVSLRWTASTSTVSGYNVYRGLTSGGPYDKLNTSLVAAESFTDSSLAVSTTYYYVTTAVNASGMESAYSNQATATIP
jgi:hypothetical protein